MPSSRRCALSRDKAESWRSSWRVNSLASSWVEWWWPVWKNTSTGTCECHPSGLAGAATAPSHTSTPSRQPCPG
ncbi:hypothetical protein [Actinomyces wuliandei]|uniref:hypothetical protein n=1 Tax=Actinomyces wuliandei TaxID=2057743 RepID=UPI00111AFC60|nr:hypothetical protein [Actinomyces wuliandei]